MVFVPFLILIGALVVGHSCSDKTVERSQSKFMSIKYDRAEVRYLCHQGVQSNESAFVCLGLRVIDQHL